MIIKSVRIALQKYNSQISAYRENPYVALLTLPFLDDKLPLI